MLSAIGIMYERISEPLDELDTGIPFAGTILQPDLKEKFSCVFCGKVSMLLNDATMFHRRCDKSLNLPNRYIRILIKDY